MSLILSDDLYAGTAKPESGGGTVINNQDITITANGEYTAESGYTGIGTATVNVPSYDTVTATNTSSAAVLEGDKVWVQPSGANYDIIDYDAKGKSYNGFKIVGQDVAFDTNTSIASGFSTTSYLRLQEPFNPSSNTWEILFKLETSNDVSTAQYIFHTTKGAGNENRFGIRTYVDGAKFKMSISTDGSSWDLSQTGTYTVLANTTYWIKFGWNGTQYYLKYSTDGNTYTDDITISSSSAVYSSLVYSYICIFSGVSMNSPWTGSLDLSESYIKVNGSDWWLSVQMVTKKNLLSEIIRSTHFSYYFIDEAGVLHSRIASGTQYSYSYVDIQRNLIGLSNQTWEFGTKFKTPSSEDMASRKNTLIASPGGYYKAGFGIELDSSGKIGFGISSNSTSWDIGWQDSSSALNANTDYWVKLKFTGSKYSLELSTDGTTFSEVSSITSSTPIYQPTSYSSNSNIRIGAVAEGTYNRYWQGEIDISETYIDIAGVRWFTGGEAVLNVNDNTLTGIASENIAIGSTGDVKVGSVVIPTKKYNLLDRVKDDSNNEIGTVSGFFTDDNDIEYAVVCLDAAYRNASLALGSDQTSVITNLPEYNSDGAQWGPWESKETATFNTQTILDYCISSTYTSDACTFCRTKSFIIDGTTYYGQLPNIIELCDIVKNHTAIDSLDATADSYPSLVLSTTGRSAWSSTNRNNQYGWDVTPYGYMYYGNKTNGRWVTPVLEIPL